MLYHVLTCKLASRSFRSGPSSTSAISHLRHLLPLSSSPFHPSFITVSRLEIKITSIYASSISLQHQIIFQYDSYIGSRQIRQPDASTVSQHPVKMVKKTKKVVRQQQVPSTLKSLHLSLSFRKRNPREVPRKIQEQHSFSFGKETSCQLTSLFP